MSEWLRSADWLVQAIPSHAEAARFMPFVQNYANNLGNGAAWVVAAVVIAGAVVLLGGLSSGLWGEDKR